MIVAPEIQFKNSNNEVKTISILANNLNFIKNERQTFLAVIAALALGTILLIVGICVLILPLGLTSALSISLGVSAIVIGSATIAYCLKVVYYQNAVWRKNYLEIRNVLREHGLPMPQEKNTDPILSILFPSSLDTLTYGSVHSMGKTRTVIAMVEIVLGIGCIVGAVISQLLLTTWFRPGISLGLGITGAALFVGGIQDIRAFSLSAQGISHLYLMQREQRERKADKELSEQIVESAKSCSTLLESNLEQANQKNLDLQTQIAAQNFQISCLQNRISTLEATPIPKTKEELTSTWFNTISSSISSISRFLTTPSTTHDQPARLLAITFPQPMNQNIELQDETHLLSSDDDEHEDLFEDASEDIASM
ncbi:IncA family protein [Chlamydia buteonis]|uniref:IncA family protein n=1 Tax=Chlamydia buteonis TaxID=2494525 RepID=A0ABX8LAD6_9CHLA|nr:IncA family protein [Chlamydia buteonis]QXE27082.1 IncA family protein [Chlamydia buteonis]QXE28353.1 IncA family protein [Chlamydia buteonis]